MIDRCNEPRNCELVLHWYTKLHEGDSHEVILHGDKKDDWNTAQPQLKSKVEVKRVSVRYERTEH